MVTLYKASQLPKGWIMKISFRALCCFVVMMLGFTFSCVGFSATTLDASLAPMLQKILPAVVNVRAQIKITDFATLQAILKQRTAQDQNAAQQPIPDTIISAASGIIVDAKNGYILTNAHVVADATKVIVTLGDGHHYNAKIIGVDKPSDVALLQIKAKNLTALVLSDSNKLKVGDYVAAIGNPFGLNQTVTSGIISALGRTALGIENYENFIQTDAPINPGNSGGALINMQGELIGVNTAILAPDRGSIGIGFAIPSNMAKSVMEQLIKYGDVKRGVLGVGAQDITPDLASAFKIENAKGAAVTQVLPNSPAEDAGIRVGDVITNVNGADIKNSRDVVNVVGFLRVDSKTNIKLLRNNKPMTVTVTLSDPKKRQEIIEKSNPYLYGVGLGDFATLSPVHGRVRGVLVTSVEQDSNAWQSDLRPGDVITSVNQEKINTIDELMAATLKADKMLLLNVLRGQAAVFLVINKEQG